MIFCGLQGLIILDGPRQVSVVVVSWADLASANAEGCHLLDFCHRSCISPTPTLQSTLESCKIVEINNDLQSVGVRGEFGKFRPVQSFWL